jgi:hypothetical protein
MIYLYENFGNAPARAIRGDQAGFSIEPGVAWPPRHEKWKETILAATIPGWKRFQSAEDWIKNDREQQLNANRDQFQQFLTARNTTADRAKIMSDADRNQLFEDFVKWMKTGTAP